MGLTYNCRVDEVYDAVQHLAQKTHRGFITAPEFNSFARKAQYEIFNMFKGMLSDKTQREYALEVLAPLIQDHSIDSFITSTPVDFNEYNTKKYIFRLDYTNPIVVVLGARTISTDDVTNALDIKFIRPDKLEDAFSSDLCPVDENIALGVHTRRVDQTASQGLTLDPTEDISTILPDEGQYIHVYTGANIGAISIRYITTPYNNPIYGVNSMTGLYDESNSTHFSLSKFSMPMLVEKITASMGVSIRDTELTQGSKVK